MYGVKDFSSACEELVCGFRVCRYDLIAVENNVNQYIPLPCCFTIYKKKTQGRVNKCDSPWVRFRVDDFSRGIVTLNGDHGE